MKAVEVVDLRKGARTHTLSGLKEPQGLVFLHHLHRLVVATGGGAVVAYGGYPPREAGRLDGLDDADNVRYDESDRTVWIGYGSGALLHLQPALLRRIGEIKLPGHPESFQLARSGALIFVNVPGARKVVAVDRQRGTVQAEIPFGRATANFPMAFDEADHRLFVGTRSPAR